MCTFDIFDNFAIIIDNAGGTLSTQCGRLKVYSVYKGLFMSKESPIVSFRLPLDAVERLIESGRLKPNYNKSELSNLIKNDWLAGSGEAVKINVDARTVDAVHSKLDKLDDILELLRGKPQMVLPSTN